MGGWNKPSTASQPVKKGGYPPAKQPEGAARRGAKAPSKVKGIVAGLVTVCALGGLCLWMFSGGDDAPKAKVEKERGRIKEVTPAAAPVFKEEPKKEEKKDNSANLERARKLKSMTPEERIDFLFAEAAAKPMDLTPTTNQPFRSSVEVSMARIFTTRLGDMPPLIYPVPLRDEAHLAEILIADNPALEGDSERIKEAKQVVELAKKELISYIKEGGDVREFLSYYHGKLDEAFREHRTAQTELLKSAKENPDIAQEYCDKINERLEAKGIKPVVLPEKFKQRWGIP